MKTLVAVAKRLAAGESGYSAFTKKGFFDALSEGAQSIRKSGETQQKAFARPPIR